ncbi:MAG: glycoside hydrolase family 16 protein [Clostridia bacterium]|nr:glycoside hydrolase family 16 protein [Clostridia bacterium]
MQKYEVEGHVPSWLPDGKQWKLIWNDEFDGTELDMTKWDYRLCMMGKRHITWGTEGVALDGSSNAVFTVYEKDGEICSSQLQTGYNFMDAAVSDKPTFGGGLVWPIGKLNQHKFLKKYGYFECRCKLQKKDGWWSAFWLQSPVIGSSLDPEFSGIENDIMESFSPGNCIHHCNHYGGYGPDHVRVDTGKGASGLNLDEYHTFAMLWNEDGYTYYIDGVEDGHVDGPVSQIPQFILISTEVQGYRGANHCASDAAKLAVGDTFVVDYVRVFDEVKG